MNKDSTDNVITKVIDVGKKFYKVGEYRKACKMFDKAVMLAESYTEDQLEKLRLEFGLSKRSPYNKNTLWHPQLCQILDNRALTHEKLCNFEKSLNDAKTMIELEPYNLKSYIRYGKTYQFGMNKCREAYLCYSKGLKMAQLGKKKYDICPAEKHMRWIKAQINFIKPSLKNNKETNNTASNYKKRISEDMSINRTKKSKQPMVKDFIDILPNELVCEIFQNLDNRDLRNCMVVNNKWNRLFYFFPNILFLKKSLNLKSTTQIRNLNSFINKCRTIQPRVILNINQLNFKSVTAVNEAKTLALLFKTFKKYDVIKQLILNTFGVSNVMLLEFIRDNEWSENLQKISIICQYASISNFEWLLLGLCPHLKDAEIIYQSFSSNRTIKIDERLYGSFTSNKSFESLETLKIISLITPQTSTEKFITWNGPPKSCKNLQTLIVAGVSLPKSFHWLHNSFPNLKTLHLEKNYNSPTLGDFLGFIFNNKLSCSLVKLTFRESKINRPNVVFSNFQQQYTRASSESNDFQASIKIFKKNLSHLKYLDFYSSSITFDILLIVLKNLKTGKLQNLNLGDCPNLLFNTLDYSASKEIWDLLPNLERLYLPKILGLSKRTLENFLIRNLHNKNRIKILDLSFNPELKGADVWSLSTTLFNNYNIILDKLILNNCESIDPNTLTLIKTKGLVKEIESNYARAKWNVFGVNSYVL
ncbi:uncharacterized protein SCODWIG_02604 [Saccharomycodes ludwigii]|uniref:F-box domain-containing protein n=1 Tax=Saccharomycodes ludwigii TaxID=36035 RepID=A0A376B826_9ASCO|nr:uncharacterized protein SCODWIG_02604 [Saccharomycodes ludwigii]